MTVESLLCHLIYLLLLHYQNVWGLAAGCGRIFRVLAVWCGLLSHSWRGWLVMLLQQKMPWISWCFKGCILRRLGRWARCPVAYIQGRNFYQRGFLTLFQRLMMHLSGCWGPYRMRSISFWHRDGWLNNPKNDLCLSWYWWLLWPARFRASWAP